jgi:hypothetical protein
MSDHCLERRRLTQRSAAFFALGTVAMRSAGAAAKPRYRMGLQLYTVREPMARDAAGTPKQAVALGYSNFETYGFEPESVKYYGMPAPDFRKVVDELGVTKTP